MENIAWLTTVDIHSELQNSRIFFLQIASLQGAKRWHDRGVNSHARSAQASRAQTFRLTSARILDQPRKNTAVLQSVLIPILVIHYRWWPAF